MEGSTTVARAGQPLTLLYSLGKGDSVDPIKIIAEEGADVSVIVLVFPGAELSVDIRADLVGRGASVKLSGLYLCGAEEKVSIKTDVRHLVPETYSNQLFNGIAGGVSNVSFYGRILVAQDAQKTEAFQTNRNILLTEGARVETKPQLEIYADDVKCSHGATIGRLDELEQFYMRSRGIPEAEAKVLQLISFLSPVLDAVPSDSREAVAGTVETTLRELIGKTR